MQDILFLTTWQAFLPNTQSCRFKQIQPNLRESMASVNFVLIWFQIMTVITRQYSKDTLILLKHFPGENDFQKTDIESRSYCLLDSFEHIPSRLSSPNSTTERIASNN
jgi:hypothetical protein